MSVEAQDTRHQEHQSAPPIALLEFIHMSEYQEDDEDFMSEEDEDYEQDLEQQYERDPADGDDEQDEQRLQVYSGKIEMLQQEVAELRERLLSEQEEHEKTRRLFDEAILHSGNSKAETLPSSALLQAFRSFCTEHDIHTHSDWDGLHDEDFKYILQEASRKIRSVEQKGDKNEQAESKVHRTSKVSRTEEGTNEQRGAGSFTQNDVRALRAKLMYLVERTRVEKEQKAKAENESALLRKTIKMLSDHIEKLMSHLKHEAAAKVKILAKQRVSDKKILELEENVGTLQKKGVAKDRLIVELREGSKILEDQLRLMDERFLEMRSKLDWVRENDEKKFRKATREAADLRARIASLSMSSRQQSNSLPNIHDTQGSYYRDASTGNLSRDEAKPKKKKKTKSKEATIESIIEKLRKQNDGKVEWTEERARELVKKTKTS